MSTATEIVTAATSAPAEPRNSGLVLLSLIRPVAVLVVRKRVCALWQLGGRAASWIGQDDLAESMAEMVRDLESRELQGRSCPTRLVPRARLQPALDGTPVLNLKPIVPDFDNRAAERIGWFEGKSDRVHHVRADRRFDSEG